MARRGENIYKRKDGRWEGRSLKQDGKYHYFYAKTYREVKEKMKEYKEDSLENITKSAVDKELASDQFITWLNGEVFARVKPSTYESYYQCVYKHILPFFQRKENLVIREDSVSGFVKYIREDGTIAETSKKKIFSIFKIAIKEIFKNSSELNMLLELVKLPPTECSEVQIFGIKEQQKIEDAAGKINDILAIGIIICFYTGIRLGELCALKWCDIDFESGTMTIMRTVSRIRTFDVEGNKTELHIGTPKSRKSIRKIPLPEFLIKLVEKYKSKENNNCFIFTGTEEPLNPRRIQKLFKKILKDCQIPDRKFHAIRHTFATRALELGVDIKTVSELLGHSGVSITLNVYAHSLMEHKKAAINKFNDLYVMNSGKKSYAVSSAVFSLESVY
ncbi:tyrosine-type recombinase/integrase [Lacrimispora sp.]|uniref:tyrosine-type recombinase/integrase n=1 Tax=Lacrimispora sp. TaxID=2719234 RepID=UPI00399684EF